ncbi:RNA-directed DNA polymerase from mobile element jockey [Pitangus sulphuratus]|nr:RNA-directed DNA polymerase from mobile element jockey [Pitangus sulphuratus]
MGDGPRGSQCPDCENDQLPVNPEIVWDLLLQLDPYKSIGPDGIHPRISKELADVITKPLSVIFEQSWESREVPADWKLANVPIFKKDKKKDPRNY